MWLAHESPTPLDEDERQDDVILDRQDVFAIDDVEVGTDGGTEGRVGAVSYQYLFRVVFEDKLKTYFRFAYKRKSKWRMPHCRIACAESSQFPGVNATITGGEHKLPRHFGCKPAGLGRYLSSDPLTLRTT